MAPWRRKVKAARDRAAAAEQERDGLAGELGREQQAGAALQVRSWLAPAWPLCGLCLAPVESLSATRNRI